jgi:MoaA/NifB/PqqE/SkfB family radical SAM enzyme
MIKIPERFNYAEAYLTLRCNFMCDYCINDANGKIKRTGEELTAQQWIDALNKIDFGNTSLTLGGGEPTMHKEFFEILKGIKPELKMDLLTNLSFDVGEFMNKTTPERFTTPAKPFYHPIRVSYHVGKTNEKETIKKSRSLINGGFSVGIFGLAHPYNINENMAMAWECNKEGVPFYTKDFLGMVDGKMYGYFKYPEGLDGKDKQAECRTRELLIAPNGDVYRCHSDLYQTTNSVSNITQPGFTIEDKFRPCNKYGQCIPCDVKLKTNRFLKGIECQVEIK